MKNLKPIVKVLMPGEIRVIRHFFKLNSNAEERKRGELFELILKNPDLTDEKAAKKLYDGPPNSAYSHLKARLKRDILNVLYLHDGGKKSISPHFKAVIESRKMLGQAFLLRTRGALNEATQLLNAASELAQKFELPGEEVLIKQTLREMIHRIKSEKVLAGYNHDISENVTLLGELMKVEEFSYMMTVPSLFSTNKRLNDPEYRKQMIQELKASFEKTGAAKIGLWYYLTDIELATKEREHDRALALALKFVKLVEKSPAIYSNNNWAGVNLTVAQTLISSGEYERAIGYGRVAIKYFPNGQMNQLMATEFLFFAQFRSKNYKDAETTLETAFNHPRLKANKFFYAKWLYLKANLLFMQGKYDPAMKTLNQDTELTKDKSGWLLGYRLLEVLIMIEKEEYEWIDFKLDSFRKLLQRQKDANIHRIKLILSMLNTLHKSNYDFEETSHDEAKNFKALKRAQDDLYWNPVGFEVVRFDEWFENRVKASVAAD